MSRYLWRDIVLIKGKCYAEEFEISGEMDNDEYYRIDEFLESVAAKHNVDVDDVKTYMMDDITFDIEGLPWGAEMCGAWITNSADEITLMDVTGVLGEWLHTGFDENVPAGVIACLEEAYKLSAKELG